MGSINWSQSVIKPYQIIFKYVKNWYSSQQSYTNGTLSTYNYVKLKRQPSRRFYYRIDSDFSELEKCPVMKEDENDVDRTQFAGIYACIFSFSLIGCWLTLVT